MGDDDDDPSTEQPELTEESTPLITADVSSVLLPSGNPNTRALRITGSIGGTTVQVLIDTGATHNFIHPKLAEKLSLHLTSITHFRVYVGNGASLICSTMCPGTALLLQGNLFKVDIHVLDVHGPDIILVMKWLQTSRRVTHDYIDMTMDFTIGERPIQLLGDTTPPREVLLHTLATLMTLSPDVDLYEMVRIEEVGPT